MVLLLKRSRLLMWSDIQATPISAIGTNRIKYADITCHTIKNTGAGENVCDMIIVGQLNAVGNESFLHV